MISEVLNIVQIEHFVKVAEIGNITQAAQQLFITQPALSRQMMNLEKNIGVELMQRSRCGVVLTENGRRFYEYSKELLMSMESFYSNVSKLCGSVVGELRIGYQASSEHLMILVNQAFVKKCPLVNIKNVRQEDKNFLEMLLTGTIDMVFNHELELTPKHSNSIKSLHMTVYQNMVLMSLENNLSKYESVHFSQLKDEKFILPSHESQPEKLSMILDHCQKCGFKPSIVRYERQINNFLIDIITNNAIAILPHIANLENNNRDYVKFVPLTGYPSEHPIGLMWSRKNANQLTELYMKAAQEVLAEGIW